MKLKKISLSVAAALSLSLASCGPKDAEIKMAAETALTNNSGVTVDVKDGVATLSGTFMDQASKTAAEAAVKAIKGVASVVDNATISPAAPPPAPVLVSPDDALKATVGEVIKEYSGLVANVKDGVVTLTGEAKKADLPKIMQALNALHPKKVDNKVTIK